MSKYFIQLCQKGERLLLILGTSRRHAVKFILSPTVKTICLLGIYITILVYSLFFLSESLSAESIKMGYFILPPHQFVVEGELKPTGVAIEYFEAVASKMDGNVEWLGPLPLLRLSEKLKSGAIDGAVSFPKVPQLEQLFHFTTTPMFFAQPILIVRKENSLKQIKSIDDVKGWRIGAVDSISGLCTPFLDNHIDLFSLDKIPGNSWAIQNINKLLIGRLDAIFDRNQFTIPFVAAKMNFQSRIKTLQIPDPPTPIHIVFSVKSKKGQVLTEKCNMVIPLLDFDYEKMAQKEMEAIAFQQK